MARDDVFNEEALRVICLSQLALPGDDCSDSDDHTPGPVNFLMAPQVPSTVFGLYLLGGDPDNLLNDGAVRVIDEVITRPGSILQPKFPAPLGLRGVTLMRNVAACLGLINVATGGQAPAAHAAYVIWYLRGQKEDGSLFLMSDGIGVGYGARPTADGIDAVYLVAQENYPAEFLDSVYPVRLRRYSIHCDTGGPGRWRGGCGIVREVEVLAPEAIVSVRIDGVENPPWGVAGGKSGGPGRIVINPGRADECLIPPISDGTIGQPFEMRPATGPQGEVFFGAPLTWLVKSACVLVYP